MTAGLMQQEGLTLDKIIDHAARWHGDREVVGREVDDSFTRMTYAGINERARRLSSALLGIGVAPGDRIATLSWNSVRHLEAWYAIVGIGAICHTLNPRLIADQIAWIVNHAGDQIIIADPAFEGMLADLVERCPTVRHIILMTDDTIEDRKRPTPVWAQDRLIDAHSAYGAWGQFSEQQAAGLCYTSGTTGDPKGVLYSHRSNYLHTLATIQPDVFALSATDVVLPIVPMFHANAWGLTFSCPAVGAKLVLPGGRADGVAIHELLEGEGVTVAAAVPTVWQMLLQHLKGTGGKLTTLKRVIVGGAAIPEGVVRSFHELFGVDVIHAWGMTEVSPLGTAYAATSELAALPFEEQLPYRLTQGRPPLGVDLKLIDDEGNAKPHDGKANGRLMVKGGFVVRRYFGGEDSEILDSEGYFDTGDVASIDARGFMRITDRAKDVIKSGGEWISSIDIENIAMSHPKTALAAVIGIPHPKWDERPVLLVKLRDGEQAEDEEYRGFLEGKIARWWMPDLIRFVDDIPLGATGKVDKKAIRALFGEALSLSVK